MSFETDYAKAFGRGLKPVSRMTVSEWADKYRMLSSVSARSPGRWRTSVTPYLKEVMDCLSNISPCERVVFMAASQVGKTETGLNWIGYIMSHAPGPILMVQPTKELAETYSKQRLAPMLEGSPILKELVKESGDTLPISLREESFP